MSPTLHRAVRALAGVAAEYPGCWQALDRLCADVRSGGVSWPEWCWAPMAASYAVVSGGQDIRGRKALDVARMAALAAWRPTQGIYCFDESLLDALWGSSVDGALPTETLLHLPEWCVYVETPGRSVLGGPLAGFWAHLEHDSNDGRIELRLLLDVEPTLIPIPLHLGRGRGTLADASQAAIDEALANAAVRGDVSLAAAIHETALPAAMRSVEPLLSVLLYLCTTAEALRTQDGRAPSKPSPKPGRRGEPPRHYPPASPAVYPTGVRIGAALRAAPSSTAHGGGQGDGRTVTPHVRRAHWHAYRVGPRTAEQRREVRWLHPILVGARDVEGLPAVVHPVEGEVTPSP